MPKNKQKLMSFLFNFAVPVENLDKRPKLSYWIDSRAGGSQKRSSRMISRQEGFVGGLASEKLFKFVKSKKKFETEKITSLLEGWLQTEANEKHTGTCLNLNAHSYKLLLLVFTHRALCVWSACEKNRSPRYMRNRSKLCWSICWYTLGVIHSVL